MKMAEFKAEMQDERAQENDRLRRKNILLERSFGRQKEEIENLNVHIKRTCARCFSGKKNKKDLRYCRYECLERGFCQDIQNL